MSGITLTQAQTNLDALLTAQANFTGVERVVFQSTSGRREKQFTSLDELTRAINYWSRMVAQLERRAAGRSKHGFSLADFRNVG